MYRIKTMNKISPVGLSSFEPEFYSVCDDEQNPDGIVVRSAKLHDMEFPESLLAIARAGVGVNNIPIERCSEKGVVVFSTPGANANAVKEMVLWGLLSASRDVSGSISWVKEQADSGIEVSSVVEKGKAAFVGPEIYKKTLGIIGLGAIGAMVANVAIGLGMQVIGYDPFISVESALRLNSHVKIVKDVNDLYKRADYLTMHVHLTDATRKMINEEAISNMKTGIRILNYARGEMVDDDAMIKALETGKVACYVTDFPTNQLIKAPHVVATPHLGASTPESEENCAVMAVDELKDFLNYGNIRNSVNLPNISVEPTGVMRICIMHKNAPGMLARFTTLCSEHGINVAHLSNKSKENYAYTILDIDTKLDDSVIDEIRHLADVIRVRVIVW